MAIFGFSDHSSGALSSDRYQLRQVGRQQGFDVANGNVVTRPSWNNIDRKRRHSRWRTTPRFAE
jgi:hypothetical protein